MPNSKTSTLIVGAGLAGSLLAIYLARRGHRLTLIERRGDPRAAGYAVGRSINLALSTRGIWGMEGVGVADEVLKHAIPMRGRVLHPASASAKLGFQPYSSNPTDAINSISRSGLNLALLEAAGREPNVSMIFNHRCLDVDLARNTATFVNDSSGETRTLEADLIAGADGAFSPVRMAMQKSDRFEYSQSYLKHGYKELHIPAAADLNLKAADLERLGGRDGWAMEPNALHIWPRGGAMMIALPNPDRTFTCTLFWPFVGEHGFERLKKSVDITSFFEQHYADAVPLMPTLDEDYLRNPSSSLVTVRCEPWVKFANDGKRASILLGDAAHAIVPFYGQGMNCAFEDCRVLAETLDAQGGNLATGLPEYERLRKVNADAIADMAIENFVEMRDKVGSPDFLYLKKLEHSVHELSRGALTPQYNLVSFSTVPYAEAQQRGWVLANVVRKLAERVPRAVAETMDTPAWLSLIGTLLPEVVDSTAQSSAR